MSALRSPGQLRRKTGRSGAAALRHGDVAGGQTGELVVKDDAGNAEHSRQIARELIGNDKVNFIGVGLTASALAVEPIVTAAKIPEVVMISALSTIT